MIAMRLATIAAALPAAEPTDACGLVTPEELEQATGLAFGPGTGETECTFVTTAGEDSDLNDSSVVVTQHPPGEGGDWETVKMSQCDGGQDIAGLGEAAYWCSEGDPPYITFMVVDHPESRLVISEVALGLDAAKALESTTAIANAAIGRLS